MERFARLRAWFTLTRINTLALIALVAVLVAILIELRAIKEAIPEAPDVCGSYYSPCQVNVKSY